MREWLPWLDGTKTVDDTRQFIKGALQGHANGVRFDNVIVHENQIVGCVGFNSIDSAHRSGAIGYWIGEDASGKGLLTNAVSELIKLAFDKMKLHRVEIRAGVENVRSGAVATRLGFTLEGTVRDAEWLYDRWVSHNIYGLLSNEWRKD